MHLHPNLLIRVKVSNNNIIKSIIVKLYSIREDGVSLGYRIYKSRTAKRKHTHFALQTWMLSSLTLITIHVLGLFRYEVNV